MAEERLSLIPADSVDGVFVSYDIDFATEQPPPDGKFRIRYGRNLANGPVVQKIAYSGARGSAHLEREIRAGTWLRGQESELISRLVGHNRDATPPFLVATCRGTPLRQVLDQDPLDAVTAHRMITDLLRALDVLRVAKVVHGAIDTETLRWDGTSLQMIDFGMADLEGRTRGDAIMRHADDVHAAALVIYRLYTGVPAEGTSEELRQRLDNADDPLRRLLGRTDRWTGRPLDNAFADRPDDRPDARELLDRWDGDHRRIGRYTRTVTERERAAREAFAELRARQHAFQARYAEWLAARPPLSPPRSSRPAPSGTVRRPVSEPPAPDHRGRWARLRRMLRVPRILRVVRIGRR